MRADLAVDPVAEPFPRRSAWLIGYWAVVTGGFMLAGIARQRVTTPFLGLSLALTLLLGLGWFLRPRTTVYATLFLAAISEYVTIPWFPFARNLSNRGSISFLADSAIVSPLDIVLVTGFLVSCLRHYADTGRLVVRTPLLRPLLVFMGFVALGFLRGVASNGDLRAALYEVRALPYILMMFVIVVNECSEREHLRAAIWSVLAGVTVQAALTIEHFSRLTPSELGNVDALTEHPAVVAQMLMIVMLVSLTLFAPRTGWLRLATLCAAVPTTFVFVTAERRSGIAALAAGALLVAVSLLWHRRRLFFLVVPALSLVLVVYVAAFWNAHGPAAFPAQAVKTVVAPNAASADNLNSDLYRILETYNLVYTIRALPLQGLGFGQLFFRPLPLPDISVFELNGYISHNAILWIWVKTGIGGFAAMFYIFAKSLLHAAERIRTTPLGIDLAMSVAAASFVVMFAVYSYVDVSWDPRNCIFLGLALAMCVRPLPRARGVVAPVLRDAHVPLTRSERAPAVRR